jgi:hypothetical protein
MRGRRTTQSHAAGPGLGELEGQKGGGAMTVYRSEIKPQTLRQAWIKIADLLCKDKP